MADNPSFSKELVKGFFVSMVRVLAIGVGLAILLIAFTILFRKPSGPYHTTTAEVLPNHNWEQGPLSSTAPTILQLDIEGVVGSDHLTYRDIRDQLVDTINGEIKKDQVKGVLLYINTPGGTVDDSDNIYAMVNEYKQRLGVPVYAFVNGLCASGGMYIACAADKIYATDASIIGSVGVLMPPMFNVYTLMDKLGIKAKTITSGKDKDQMNPFRMWKDNEGQDFQSITNTLYGRFVSIVSKARPSLTQGTLEDLGARVFVANQAQELGYIDGKINTIEEMLEKMTSELGIQNNYQFVRLKSKNWLDEFFMQEKAIFQGKMQHEIRLPGDLPAEFYGKPLYLYRP